MILVRTLKAGRCLAHYPVLPRQCFHLLFFDTVYLLVCDRLRSKTLVQDQDQRLLVSDGTY